MNEKEKTNPEFTVTVAQILRIIKRYIIPIALITVTVAVAAFIVNVKFIKPKYRASATIYVQSKDYNQIGTNASVSSSDLTVAQRLANTYSIIIRTDDVLNEVVEKLGDDVNVSAIKRSLTAESVDNTEIFTISYVDTDPERAMNIVNAVAEIAPDKIKYVVQTGRAKAIQKQAKAPTNPISPHKFRNTAIAGAAAFLLSSFVFVLISVLDTRIRSVEDLSENFGLPVFGSIPTISTDVQAVEKEDEADE